MSSALEIVSPSVAKELGNGTSPGNALRATEPAGESENELILPIHELRARDHLRQRWRILGASASSALALGIDTHHGGVTATPHPDYESSRRCISLPLYAWARVKF